jgi:hypothetical protein
VLSPLYYNNNKKNKCDISAHCAQSKNWKNIEFIWLHKFNECYICFH